MAMPAIQAFNKRFPNVSISVLTKPGMKPLWGMHPAVSDVIDQPNGFPAIVECARGLKQRSFDAAYVLPHSFRSALTPFLARIPRRLGMPGHCRDFMLTGVIRPSITTTRYHQKYEYADLFNVDIDNESPCVVIPRDAAARAVEAMDVETDSLVGILPGAAFGPGKRWPVNHFRRVAQELVSEMSCTVVLFGTAAEAEACDRISSGKDNRIVNMAGRTTIPELAACLSMCRVVLANDSGGAHLAAAAGAAVVVVFGVTDPAKTSPIGSIVDILQDSTVAGRDMAASEDIAVEALNRITPETVLSRMKARLTLTS